VKAAKPKGLHPRNLHSGRYDMQQLSYRCPDLVPYLRKSPRGGDTIDFSDADAVRTLNRAILCHHYGIQYWDIPKENLCPPIPGRADYLHYIADLLAADNKGEVPSGKAITGLDVGTGASCIYPILGSCSYGWQFIASDIAASSVAWAKELVKQNRGIASGISVRLQNDSRKMFENVIGSDERVDFVICNPPFHKSAREARSAAKQKQTKLGLESDKLNFAGMANELWCKGGEEAFLATMVKESAEFSTQCLWFTALVSKRENVSSIKRLIKKSSAAECRVIEMAQGQKISRFIAWSYLNEKERKDWATQHWCS